MTVANTDRGVEFTVTLMKGAPPAVIVPDQTL
jgi:hypothetical protein